jgi:hypothetical protein
MSDGGGVVLGSKSELLTGEQDCDEIARTEQLKLDDDDDDNDDERYTCSRWMPMPVAADFCR